MQLNQNHKSIQKSELGLLVSFVRLAGSGGVDMRLIKREIIMQKEVVVVLLNMQKILMV